MYSTAMKVALVIVFLGLLILGTLAGSIIQSASGSVITETPGVKMVETATWTATEKVYATPFATLIWPYPPPTEKNVLRWISTVVPIVTRTGDVDGEVILKAPAEIPARWEK